MACLIEAEQNNLTPILDVAELVETQQETFQKLQSLALAQTEECGSGNNPELFAMLEEILKPLYLNWGKKYDQVKELMKKESSRQFQEENYFHQILIQPQPERILLRYSKYYTHEYAFLARELRISSPGRNIYSLPELIGDRGRTGVKERFHFQTSVIDGPHYKDFDLKIEEDIKGNTFGRTRDSLFIEGTKTITPIGERQTGNLFYPRVGNSFAWSCYRNSLSQFPVARRLEQE
jgi:hypothetical protein